MGRGGDASREAAMHRLYRSDDSCGGGLGQGDGTGSDLEVGGPVLQLPHAQQQVHVPDGQSVHGRVGALLPRRRHRVHEERVAEVLHVGGDGQLTLPGPAAEQSRPSHTRHQSTHAARTGADLYSYNLEFICIDFTYGIIVFQKSYS